MTEKKTQAAAGATPADLSTEQLLTEIGKLVYQVSKQGETLTGKIEALDALSRKVDAIEALISGGLFERLDRIGARLDEPLRMELQQPPASLALGEAPPSGAQAGPSPDLAEKMGAISSGLRSLETAVVGSGRSVSESFQAASQPLHSRLDALEQRLQAIGDLLARPSADRAVDLGGLAGEIALLRTDMAGFVESAGKPSGQIDISPLTGVLADVRKDLGAIQEVLSRPAERQTTDLSGILQVLSEIRTDLAGLQEALSRPAQPVDFSSLTSALGEVRSDIAGVTAALAGATGQPDFGSILQSLSEVRAEVSALAGSITSGVGDSVTRASASIEKKIESGSDGLSTKADAVAAGLQAVASRIEEIQKAVSWKEVPEPLASEFDSLKAYINTTSEALGDAVATSGREVSTAVSAGIESIGGAVSRQSVAPEVISALEAIRNQMSSVSEAFTTTVSSTGAENTQYLGVRLEALSGVVSALPGCVREMQESLATQFGDFSGTARETLAGVQTSVESSRKMIEGMEKVTTKAAEEQKQTLVKMTDLLTVQRDQVLRAEVEDLNNEGIHLLNEGRNEEAAASIEKAIQIDPSKPELWSNLGHARAASGRLDDAEECFRKALSLDGSLEPALSGLGVLLVRAGRPRETLDFLRKNLESGTASAGVIVACSRALAASGKHAEAVSLLQKAAAASPGNADLEQELSHYSEKR